MQRFAAVAGLPRRRILPVPVLSPSLSSHWVNLVTPVPRSLARPLVESLQQHGCRAASTTSRTTCPTRHEGLIGYDRAVELALTKIQSLDVPDHLVVGGHAGSSERTVAERPRLGWWLAVRRRARARGAGPPGRRCGGSSRASAVEHGWYSFPLGWRVRGWIDRLTGGPGPVRGRRDPDNLLPGDSLDWWRVEEVERGPAAATASRDAAAGSGLARAAASSTPTRPTSRRCSTSGRCFIRAASPVTSTGGRSGRSTARLRQHAAQHRPGRRAAPAGVFLASSQSPTYGHVTNPSARVTGQHLNR